MDHKEKDLLKLQKGDKFNISGEQWRVLNINTYEWEDGENTIEYELRNKGKTIFLEIEKTGNKLLFFLSNEINASTINKDFESGSDYDKIIYKDEVYTLDEDDYAKYVPQTSGEDAENVRAVSYKNGKKFVTIEFWDDNSIEYYAGSSATKNDFSNVPTEFTRKKKLFNWPSKGTLVFFGVIGLLIIILFFNDDEGKPAFAVSTNPTNLIHQNLYPASYTVILDDIDIEETAEYLKFKHKYVSLVISNDSIIIDTIGWKAVSKSYFAAHVNDLGMEIVSYHHQRMDAFAKPIGFGWAIGDSTQGSWQTKIDSFEQEETVWEPKEGSQYYNYWYRNQNYSKALYMDYETNYKGKKAFYGQENGQYQFGTRSEDEKRSRTYYYRRLITNLAWQTYYDQKKKRESSRYSGGSSTRGRSGGFGK